jgi:D-alanyl-D-alanine endopeptidase (penicillin-binding protein 7)
MKRWTAALASLALLFAVVQPALAAGAETPLQVSKSKAAKTVKSAKSAKAAVVTKSTSRTASTAKSGAKLRASRKLRAVAVPARPSYGQLAGLHSTGDDLALKSSVALVVDQDTNEILLSKNPSAVLPIASITKLMTALVVTESLLPLDEMLVVSKDDVVATAGSKSRLREGTQLSRGDMLHLALMASENRAAHVLGRSFPGGVDTFVGVMNSKAALLGMADTRYVEPTGLSPSNQSSAQDLARLVRAAFEHPIIRDLSTSQEMVVPVGHRSVAFRSTNGLVRNADWEIGLQKTGYISAAGRCLVMQTQLAGRRLIMVLLDSAGKYSRIGDAERIRKWMRENPLLSSLSAPGTQPR